MKALPGLFLLGLGVGLIGTVVAAPIGIVLVIIGGLIILAKDKPL